MFARLASIHCDHDDDDDDDVAPEAVPQSHWLVFELNCHKPGLYIIMAI